MSPLHDFRSHGTESATLDGKWCSGTSKDNEWLPSLLPYCITCYPAQWILYHVTKSCKGPIAREVQTNLQVTCIQPGKRGWGRGVGGQYSLMDPKNYNFFPKRRESDKSAHSTLRGLKFMVWYRLRC